MDALKCLPCPTSAHSLIIKNTLDNTHLESEMLKKDPIGPMGLCWNLRMLRVMSWRRFRT